MGLRGITRILGAPEQWLEKAAQGGSAQRLRETSGTEGPGPVWTLSLRFLFLGEWDVGGLVLWISVQKSPFLASLPRASITGAHSGVGLDFVVVSGVNGIRALAGAS